MSFGWSAGDIVSAVQLVTKIIQCVGSVGGSREHFQELSTELHGLLRALDEISELTRIPDQIPEITSLKFAACLCGDTLSTFLKKIEPFDASLGASSAKSKLRAAPRMVRWELLVKKDIPELRSYLVAHVGTLNLRLNTTQLKIAAKSRKQLTNNHDQVQQSSQVMQSELAQVKVMCEKIASIAENGAIPKLDALMSIVTKVWKDQNELIQRLAFAVEKAPHLDTNYTWAQAPVKFEDALGRIIPVASEYNWTILKSIIEARFQTGPGSEKVRSGEWELFSSMGNKSSPSLVDPDNLLLIPGMSITMAFVIGQYGGSERCARLGCSSQAFSEPVGMSVRTCLTCGSWVRKSAISLPKPLKPPSTEFPISGVSQNPGGMQTTYKAASITAKEGRRYFKNVSIYITELPPTPKSFRDKYTRDYECHREEDTNHRTIQRRWRQSNPSTSSKKPANSLGSERRHAKSSQLPLRAHSALMRNVTRAVAGFRTATMATTSYSLRFTSTTGRRSTKNVPNESTKRSPNVNLIEDFYPAYNLSWESLKSWLEKKFPGHVFSSEPRIHLGLYMFDVPMLLTEKEREDIFKLCDQETPEST